MADRLSNSLNDAIANIKTWQPVTPGTPSSGTLQSSILFIKNEALKLAILSCQINGNSADATMALNINVNGSVDKHIYAWNAYNNTQVNCYVDANGILHIKEAAALVRIYCVLPLV